THSHSLFCSQRPRAHPALHSFPTRRSSDLDDAQPGLPARKRGLEVEILLHAVLIREYVPHCFSGENVAEHRGIEDRGGHSDLLRSEEHTSELQSLTNIVFPLLLQKTKHTTP